MIKIVSWSILYISANQLTQDSRCDVYLVNGLHIDLYSKRKGLWANEVCQVCWLISIPKIGRYDWLINTRFFSRTADHQITHDLSQYEGGCIFLTMKNLIRAGNINFRWSFTIMKRNHFSSCRSPYLLCMRWEYERQANKSPWSYFMVIERGTEASRSFSNRSKKGKVNGQSCRKLN